MHLLQTPLATSGRSLRGRKNPSLSPLHRCDALSNACIAVLVADRPASRADSSLRLVDEEMFFGQVMLRVTDLDASIKYYTEALGMTLLKKKDNEQYKYTLAFLSYGELVSMPNKCNAFMGLADAIMASLSCRA